MKIVIGPSRRETVTLFFGCLFFTVIGSIRLVVSFSGGEPDSRMEPMDYCALLLFGSGTVMAVRWFAFDRPFVVINDKGVLLRWVGSERIPWADIKGAYIKPIYNGDQCEYMEIICLEIPNPERYMRPIDSNQREFIEHNLDLGLTPIIINPYGYGVDSNDVLDFIHQRIQIPAITK